MKTGVIVARFQIDYLSHGHLDLVRKVRKKYTNENDKVLIILGESEVYLTNRNPLNFEFRKAMLQEQLSYINNIVILRITDNRSNEVWSENLDNLLSSYKNVTLFHSRDSFMPCYTGKHKTKEIKVIFKCSATERRREIANLDTVVSNASFRQGIIYTVENKFPTAYTTVDIAVLRIIQNPDCTHEDNYNKLQLLLGRKPGRDKYCFIGGFVDPTDSCLESAAGRELSEEVPGLMTHEFKYVSSHKVDDFRYKGTKDGIMTSLMITYKLGGSEKAGDDIEEVKWFNLKNFDYENILTPHHHKLFESLKKYLKL